MPDKTTKKTQYVPKNYLTAVKPEVPVSIKQEEKTVQK